MNLNQKKKGKVAAYHVHLPLCSCFTFSKHYVRGKRGSFFVKVRGWNVLRCLKVRIGGGGGWRVRNLVFVKSSVEVDWRVFRICGKRKDRLLTSRVLCTPVTHLCSCLRPRFTSFGRNVALYFRHSLSRACCAAWDKRGQRLYSSLYCSSYRFIIVQRFRRVSVFEV